MNKISEWCTSMAQMISNLLQIRRQFNVEMDKVSLNGKPFIETVSRINDILSKIMDALGKDDRTQLADLLEFELGGLIAGLKGIFPPMRQRIAEVFNCKT
ncbi:MAG: hypothetical protein HQL31_11640 [Planctomycetes bacterium]|nr:hypothetical protein [Planctomycetota bacterium]